MKIAIEGCAHGELDIIYNTIKRLEEKEGFKIDLLICCGDFQATRNEQDLRCMAVPPKYYNICSFYKYYTGEKTAPFLTIFIGGNHEASNHLQELPYGGWVAPKIYYLGYAGVINVAGVRIGGLSGIYKGADYLKGHYEHTPYNDNSKRSVYHIRNLEVFRLKQLSDPLNIFLSHDWPSGIWNYGDKEQLIRFKPFLKEDISSDRLGSRPAEELLNTLKPDYWFAAHLHCKFAALVPHSCGKITRFLSLDKCLPKRKFLQIIDIPHNTNSKIELSYDLEWLTILRLTNHLLSVKNVINYMPGPNGRERWSFTPTEEEKFATLKCFGDDLLIPNNFVKTVKGYDVQNSGTKKHFNQPNPVCNPQTVYFCEKLYVDDPLNVILNLNNIATMEGVTEISIDQTCIEETDESAETNLLIKKIPLSLPEPVKNDETFENSTLNETGNNYNERNEKKSSNLLPDNIDSDVVIDADCGSDVTVSSKKFKRRNATIYQSDDVDN